MANSIAEQVHLRNKVWSLTVLPDKGACVSSCQCFGFPVMHSGNLKQIETGNIFSASCFPMVPYSNRIENGIFSFQGQTQHIQKNHPDNIFPIHGTGWEKSWQIDRETETHCDLSMTYSPEAGGWPWVFKAQQKIKIEGVKLTYQLSIKNKDRVPFPVGLGLHPSFSNALTAQARFKTGDMWACDARLIPVRKTALTPETDFSQGKKIQNCQLDNCFEDWDGFAQIKWPLFEGAIHMKASPEFSSLVVYIDSKNDYFCLEPVTHVNNALNMDCGRPMKVLKPNETFSADVVFSYIPTAK